MGTSNLKAPLVVIAAAVCLAILMGASALYERSSSQIPVEEALAGHPGVMDFSVSREDVWVVDLTLGEVEDLRGACTELDEAVRDILGGSPYRLEIGDAPDEELTRLWAELEIIVQQGAASGRFADMRDDLRAELSAAEDVQLDVQVDGRNIFVAMTRGESYLYRVVPRTDYPLVREESGE
ncbi:MAG: hypothetical protein R6U70_03950 [Bacillota bacterium]